MEIIKEQHKEDCLDGTAIFQLYFNVPLQKEIIMKLEPIGQMDFFEDFPRPFYRVRGNNGFYISGVIGENNFQLISKKDEKEKIIGLIVERFNN